MHGLIGAVLMSASLVGAPGSEGIAAQRLAVPSLGQPQARIVEVHHKPGHTGGRGRHLGWTKKNRGKHKGWYR